MFQISYSDFLSGLQKLNRDFPLYVTSPEADFFYFRRIPRETWQNEYWHFAPYRTVLPLKNIYLPPLQKVCEYPGKDPEQPDRFQPVAIVGAKACDVQALFILDQVYAMGDYPEPFYLRARKENILITTDCLEAGPHCYCTLFKYQPYPKREFDLNLSLVKEEYLIEIGSEKGKRILTEYFSGLKEASNQQILEREKQRERITEQVRHQNREFRYYESHQKAIERHLDSPIWQDLSKTCVECGTCTQICPTCHCFLLYDQPAAQRFERVKVWDSCFFAGYARMAGGGTPRLSLAERFKNRFYHKFDSFVTNFGMEACTGCGRCVEGCMGKIDLREVLLELEKRVVLKEPLDLM